MLEVRVRALQPYITVLGLGCCHWQKATVCSALGRHRGFWREGASPTGLLCARARALGSCGAWPGTSTAGELCGDGGCLPAVRDRLSVPGFAGTPGYLSPEVLRKDPYGKAVDLWACGKSDWG